MASDEPAILEEWLQRQLLHCSTNLTAKVQFSRVILEGGKLADPIRDVQFQPAAR